jgi:hypothetical protein
MPHRIRASSIVFNLNDDRPSPGFLCRIAHIAENFASEIGAGGTVSRPSSQRSEQFRTAIASRPER